MRPHNSKTDISQMAGVRVLKLVNKNTAGHEISRLFSSVENHCVTKSVFHGLPSDFYLIFHRAECLDIMNNS